jgi:hypothetical protein
MAWYPPPAYRTFCHASGEPEIVLVAAEARRVVVRDDLDLHVSRYGVTREVELPHAR